MPPAYASGPSVAARHLPTLWGVTLYTREVLPGEHCSPLQCTFSTVWAPLRGELSPKVTEGWLSGCPCAWAHPSPPNGRAPLEGEPHSAPAILAAVGASIARPHNLTLPQNPPGAHCAPLQLNFRLFLGPGGVNVGRGKNPLRKMQHSCIF